LHLCYFLLRQVLRISGILLRSRRLSPLLSTLLLRVLCLLRLCRLICVFGRHQYLPKIELFVTCYNTSWLL
jgi:hypothetical protein